MGESIYVITPDRLIPYGDKFVVRLFESDNLVTKEDGPDRACKDGDVLSIDPEGNWSGRKEGTTGPYELCRVVKKGLLYSPKEHYGKSFLVAYVDE